MTTEPLPREASAAAGQRRGPVEWDPPGWGGQSSHGLDQRDEEPDGG